MMPNLPLKPELLRQTELFAGLTDADLQTIQQAATVRQVERDGFFFYQGDPAEQVLALTEGRVRLAQVTPDGQQVILNLISAGALFGIIAAIKATDYPVSAQAMEDSTALAWSREAMMGLVGRFPLLGMNIMRLMAEHVQETQNRLRELTTERVERRLARTLLRLAAQTGVKTPEGVEIGLALTRQDLAEMIGATLYTVSRILSQWEAQGLVRSGRERVMIRFPHGLVSIAEDLPQRE